MKILFIGQNPSKKNIDANIPFLGTKSYKVLMDWIKILEIDNYHIINASNKVGKVTIKDADPTLTVIAYGFILGGYQVIALGNYASRVCEKNEIPHFKLSHPSGLNRLLNNPNYINSMLKKCKKYILGES